MPWNLCHLPESRVVQVTYQGMVPPAELRAVFAACVAACQQHQTLRVLADCRSLTGGHSVMDLFDLVLELDQARIGPSFREAVLLTPGKSSEADVAFWETSCRNRGLNVRIFTDQAAALAWLTEAPAQ